MLQQVGAFWAAAPFQIDLIYRTGRRFIRDIAGAVTRDDIAWDPDTEPERHARWWMVFFWPNAINSDGLWDDPGVWDDGGVWDSDLTAEDVADVRIVPADWNNARCQGTIVLLPPEIELWDYPIGTWDEPGGVWADDYSAVTVSVD
jgi:hypothetical protein